MTCCVALPSLNMHKSIKDTQFHCISIILSRFIQSFLSVYYNHPIFVWWWVIEMPRPHQWLLKIKYSILTTKLLFLSKQGHKNNRIQTMETSSACHSRSDWLTEVTCELFGNMRKSSKMNHLVLLWVTESEIWQIAIFTNLNPAN